MSEERKFAILIPDKLTPKKVGTVETVIRHAAYILGEIDKK